MRCLMLYCAQKGTTKIPHFDDNCASQKVVLSQEEMDLVAAAVPYQSVSGERYAAGDASTFKGQMGADASL